MSVVLRAPQDCLWLLSGGRQLGIQGRGGGYHRQGTRARKPHGRVSGGASKNRGVWRESGPLASFISDPAWAPSVRATLRTPLRWGGGVGWAGAGVDLSSGVAGAAEPEAARQRRGGDRHGRSRPVHLGPWGTSFSLLSEPGSNHSWLGPRSAELPCPSRYQWREGAWTSLM